MRLFLLLLLPFVVWGFKSSEHKNIGDHGYLKAIQMFVAEARTSNDKGTLMATYLESKTDPEQDEFGSGYLYPIKLQPTAITYGEAVAWMGDAFGPASLAEVVCFHSDQPTVEGAILGVVEQMLNSQNVPEKNAKYDRSDGIDALREWIREENVAIQRAKTNGTFPSDAIGKLSPTRMMKLPWSWNILFYNFDHFADCALATYDAAHGFALKIANQVNDYYFGVRDSDDPKLRHRTLTRLVNKMLLVNALADHAASDQFAPGHFNVHELQLKFDPRSPCYGSPTRSGLTVNAMHDEENKNGMCVTSAHQMRLFHEGKGKKGWMAFGDSRYFDDVNSVNREHVIEAVAVSLLEVFRAAALLSRSNPTPNQWRPWDYFPSWDLTRKYSPSTHKDGCIRPNPCEMFRMVTKYKGNHLKDVSWERRSTAATADMRHEECGYKTMHSWDCLGLLRKHTLVKVKDDKYGGVWSAQPSSWSKFIKVGLHAIKDKGSVLWGSLKNKTKAAKRWLLRQKDDLVENDEDDELTDEDKDSINEALADMMLGWDENNKEELPSDKVKAIEDKIDYTARIMQRTIFETENLVDVHKSAIQFLDERALNPWKAFGIEHKHRNLHSRILERSEEQKIQDELEKKQNESDKEEKLNGSDEGDDDVDDDDDGVKPGFWKRARNKIKSF